MNESARTRKLCEGLRKLNAMVYAAVAGEKGTSGWPDRYVHHRTWQGWLEFKDGTRKCTPLQQEIIRGMNARCCGSAYVVRHGANTIENHDGEVLATFDGTATSLLGALEDL
jgi:hypothetical protein